jgi:hypothetical protein
MGLNVRRFGHPHHFIIVEITLFDAAVADGDFAVEGRGQTVNDAAFDLHGNRCRVDDVATIDHAHEALNADFALGRYCHLGDFADDGAKGFVDGDPASFGSCEFLVPPYCASVSRTQIKSPRPESSARR